MSESNFHDASFKSFNINGLDKYTPVPHGEPSSHGATVYGIIPPT